MPNIAIDKKVPAFNAPMTGGEEFSIAQHKGNYLVLYFYPKDSTPGCTKESQAFRDQYAKFKRLQTLVVGVSRDSLRSHENFIAKQELPFPLISDQDEAVCSLFDVIKMKSLYGKQVRGIERSTFLIDDQSVLRGEWRKVKVDGHVDEVLAVLKRLSKP